MNILDPAYIKLWFQIAFPFILILAACLVPLFGIWYELRKMRMRIKNLDFLSTLPPSDDDGPYDQFEERIR
jgi:hypothetical protein